RRGFGITLTNGRIHRFAGIPRLANGFLLPLPGRQYATTGLRHVYAGVTAESESKQKVVHHVDAHICCEIVKINITGLVYGFFQIDHVVPATINPPGPVVVNMAAAIELEMSWILHLVFAGAQAG